MYLCVSYLTLTMRQQTYTVQWWNVFCYGQIYNYIVVLFMSCFIPQWFQQEKSIHLCNFFFFFFLYFPIIYRKLCEESIRSTLKSHDLVLLWQRESWWVYAGPLSSELDRERYWETVSHTLNKYFNEDPMVDLQISYSFTWVYGQRVNFSEDLFSPALVKHCEGVI